MKSRHLQFSLALTGSLCLLATSLTAATFVWDGGDDGTDLGKANNWNPNGSPVANDVLQWNGSVSGDLSLSYTTLNAGLNTNPGISISLTSGQTSALTIDGGANALRLNASGINIASGAGAFSLGNGSGTSNITAFNGNMAMVNNSSNTATLASDLVFATTFAGITNYNFNGTGNWQVNANLRASNNGASAVTALGTGTVTFSAANTYTGLTTIGSNGSAAVIRATVSGALGSGQIFIPGNGGSNRLELSGGITLSNALAVNGKNNVIGQPAAILNVSGNNSLTGTVTVNVGGSHNTIQSDAGTLTLGAATALTSGATGVRNVLFTGSGNIDVTGAITNGSSSGLVIEKQGSGTLTLGGTNTYTGTTTVSAGTLLANGSLTSNVTVTTDGTIGGTGTITGNLQFNSGANLTITNLTEALTVIGSVSFASGFGIDDLAGIDWSSVDLFTPYTLLDNGTDFSTAGLDNFGIANAAPVGGGRSAYFQNGSLQLVVIPEPATAALGALGLLAMLRRRRH
jgi:autotransporter-associated beta strand protein